MLSRMFYYMLTTILLSACQSVPENKVDANAYLYDDFFPEYKSIGVESIEEIFSLNEGIRKYLDENLLTIESPPKRMAYLAEELFAPDSINISYKNDATSIAIDTFKNKEANCLSLTILAYAMAEYSGFVPLFQNIEVPEYWVIREGYGVVNGHVNLVVVTKVPEGGGLSDRTGITVDFDGSVQSRYFERAFVPKNRIVAIYYNNKGADALIENKPNEAYAYFRAAMSQDPFFIPTWGNLGVLYRHIGKGDSAELIYRAALKLKENDKTLLSNLSIHLRATGRESEASKIERNLERNRKKNPYYHYYLGEVEYNKKNWQVAKKHYLKSIALSNKVDHFYFALAKTYFQLGFNRRAQKNLKKAKRYSVDERASARYQNKLIYLQSL